MRRFFQGWGFVGQHHFYAGLVLRVERATVGTAEVVNHIYPLDVSAIQKVVPLDVRVAVEGIVNQRGTLEVSYIGEDKGEDENVNTQQVTTSQQEFDKKAHEEFKQGLRYGMNIAINLLKRAAVRNFEERKDADAKLLRDLAVSLEEERETQRKTDYSIRPHIE